MTLPYVRTVPFLSPSALKMLEESPAQFYFRRLGPPEFSPPREEQSFPAACGIAFDAMVKDRVAKECGFRAPSLEFMLNEVRFAHIEDIAKRAEERTRCLNLARGLLAGYESSGALRRLLEERPTAVAVDGEDFAPGTRVPVRTRIDCLTEYGGFHRIHDWKVSGSGRPGTHSPTPGFNLTWDTDQPGVPTPSHHKFGLPLEELNSDWATQITMYGWAQGYPISENVVGSIDEVCVWHGERVRVAQFRAKISVAFQQGVKSRLEDAWRRIESREVIDPNMTLEQARILL